MMPVIKRQQHQPLTTDRNDEKHLSSKQAIDHLVYAIAFVDMISSSIVVTNLASYLKDANYSASSAGALLSLYGLVQFFSAPLIGAHSDRYGFRSTLLTCLYVCAIAYTLLIVDYWPILLLMSRLLAGAFKQTQNLCRSMVAQQFSDDGRDQQLNIFGRLNAIGSFAFIIVPSIAGALAARFGYRFVFIVAASGFVFNALIVHRFYRQQHTSTVIIDRNPLDTLLSHFRQVNWTSQWDLIAIRFVHSITFLIYRSNFDWLMSSKFATNTETIGYLITIQAIASCLASFSASRIFHALGGNHTRLLTIGCILLSLALTGMYLSSSFVVYCICLLTMNTVGSWIRVLTTDMMVHRCAIDQVGAIFGVSASVIAVARTFAPIVGGTMYDLHVHLSPLFAVVCAIATVYIANQFTVVNQIKYVKMHQQ